MTETIYLGGYTKRTNKGIATVQLNRTQSALTTYEQLVVCDNPTYLVRHHNYLYSVVREGDCGGVAVIDSSNGTIVSQYLRAGVAPPCHIAVDAPRQQIYVSYYHDGSLQVLSLTSDGRLQEKQLIQHQGNSVRPEQQSAHVHYAGLTADQRYVLVCDLGCDQVVTYQPQPSGALEAVATLQTPAGFGPRHLVCHPQLPLVYVFGELSSEVLVVTYDAATGQLVANQKIATIPESYQEGNGGSAIRISDDGQFVYAANRGHDSLVVFAVDRTGALSVVDWYPTGGHIPRDFQLTADNRYVIVAHQESDHLVLFERCAQSGRLTLVDNTITAPECVCVCV